MKILTRYLLRAHIGPFLFAFLALTGVVLINTLARRLADLAGKGLPMRVVLEFFVLALPATVALTFPMAVLVSILYTFTHFTAENEITAMKASGLDLKRLLLPLLGVAAVLTGIMIWFNDRVLPEANHRWSQLFVDIARKTPTLILQAQTINRISPTTGGSQTYYLRAARVDPATNRLFDVSIYDVSNPSVLRTIYADSGRALFNATRTDLVMRLYDGHMREITMDDPATFRRMAFKEQVFGIPGVGTTLPTGERGNAFRGDREMTVGMLQARIDTLRKERSDLHKRMRNLVGADLNWALSGGTRAFRADGDTTTAPPPVVSPEESGVRVRTRRTADELESVRIRSAELSQQMREYEVEVHKKYSIAVASLVFVILGAPLALRFGGGGIGMVIAASMIIFSLYYIGLIGGESLAGRGIVTPLVAMWVVNALMTVLGLIGLATMGRETSTARSGLWDNLAQGVRGFFRRGSRA
ncbi:MAG TPA: LptF/LptG family permease [Longimicrobium sp.]|nr:LptF/LptG family permease [Longimicrobium sp.]